jgi:adenine-specific DNA-methyltransferase
MIIFSDTSPEEDTIMLSDVFNIYVGFVSGKDCVFKNNEFGNIQVLNSNNKNDTFIYVKSFPTKDTSLNTYLEKNKEQLLDRKIRLFNDDNWFEWGAPRNIKTIEKHRGKDCIYVCNMTRKDQVDFVGKVQYFGGTLIMLLPKSKMDLYRIVDYLNSNNFKDNFMSSGRFKIGHRQLLNSQLY